MTVLEFTAAVGSASVVAGFLGSLTGLGGGVVVTPVLVLILGVDLPYAIGASLVSVIATSSGAAAAYVREGFSNVRIGMFLELATTVGAVVGASLAAYASSAILSVIFGVVLLVSAALALGRHADKPTAEAADSIATRLKLHGSYPTATGEIPYAAQHVPAGFTLMFGAGILSGLLGIGSGALKVLAMDQAMRLPFKVSTATSNFMIGVTAAASAGIYWSHGKITPGVAMPVMLGVLAGSMLGARLLARAQVRQLRLLFAVVIAALAVQMIYNGLRGRI
jgi:uncharacterized membrane protein YfcA